MTNRYELANGTAGGGKSRQKLHLAYKNEAKWEIPDVSYFVLAQALPGVKMLA